MRVFWSNEDQAHIATFDELPQISGVGETPEVAVQELATALYGSVQALMSEIEAVRSDTREACAQIAESRIPRHTECGMRIAKKIREQQNL